MKKALSRVFALLLVLTLLCTSAFALTVNEARELLQTYYVDEVPREVLEQPTIEAMLEKLGDPYTEYFDAETYKAFMASMQDADIVGIGVASQAMEQGITLTAVYEGSPAAAAGVQVGDVITSVDGKSAAGETLDVVSSWIRGEEGTSVTLTVLREGVSKTFTMVRAHVVIPATSSALVDGHIGYIECTTFGTETYGHFANGIEKYDTQADRWIVDLRGNGGGDVSAAVNSAGAFAGTGNYAYLRERSGNYLTYASREGGLTLDPAIVLVNGYTASSSELFSTAIRDGGAGIVIGSRTFGKGVAQGLLDESVLPGMFTDGSALKMTMSRYFSAVGASTDKVGVIPHLLVDDSQTADVAYLLSASNPKGNTSGLLRMDMTWRWYVDLDTATSKDYKEAFAALLEAIPPTTNLWLGTGGSEGWKSVTAAEVAKQYNVSAYRSRGFSDVADSAYASQIDTLATYGILSGDGTGKFLPDDALTRAEFCALLAQATRYAPKHQGSTYYSDVAAGEWYADSVAALTDAGLMNGYSDGLFHPDDALDHQQFITVMARLGEKLNMYLYEAGLQGPDAEILADPIFADYDRWAQKSLWLTTRSQQNMFGQYISILWDVPENFTADGVTTRGEAAAAMYNVLNYAGILPA